MRHAGAVTCILLILLLASPAAHAQSVTLGTGDLELAPGQTGALPVWVAGVQGLYGFEIHLRYDPRIVHVVDSEPQTVGVQAVLGDFLSTDFVVQNEADNNQGTVDVSVWQLDPSEPKNGDGLLFVLELQGITPGVEGMITVTGGALTDQGGGMIPAEFAGAVVRVVGPDGVPTVGVPEQPTDFPDPTMPPPPAFPTQPADLPTPLPLPTAGAPAPTMSVPTPFPTPALPTDAPPPAFATFPASAPTESLSFATPAPRGPTDTPALVAKARPGAPPAAPAAPQPPRQAPPTGLLVAGTVFLVAGVLAGLVLLGLTLRRR